MSKQDKCQEPVQETNLSAENEAKQEEKATVEEPKVLSPWEDKVPVKLFKDNQNYKDDVFVSVNGHHFQIKRGIEVMVPRCVAKVLMNSERAKTELEERLAKLTQTEDGYHKYADM